MKRIKETLVVLFAGVALAASLRGQGFVNLGFESAQVIITTNVGDRSFIASINALPGWSAFVGTNQLSLIQYNLSTAGINPSVELVGSNADVIDGNFSVYEASGDFISQTGLVPTGSETLFVDATSLFLASLDGQNLPFTAISSAYNSSGHSYTLYAADVSAFAGQIATLTFSPSFGTYGFLDDIQFSPEAVPEPTSAAVILLGGGLLFYARRKYHR